LKMAKFRQKVVTLGLTAVLTLSLAACGSSSYNATEMPSEAAQAAEIPSETTPNTAIDNTTVQNCTDDPVPEPTHELVSSIETSSYVVQTEQHIPMPSVNDIISFGDYDWIVLDVSDTQALLVAQEIIEYRKYNEKYDDMTWESSGIREYLNNEFISQFNEEDVERIITTDVITPANSLYSTNGGNNTQDKIFLLSLDEVLLYFGDSGGIENHSSDDKNAWFTDEYADKRKATYQGSETSGQKSWWYLRTPGSYAGRVVCIDDPNGYDAAGIDVGGINISTQAGIRPALWLDMSEK
jgi:hypothetical protein